MTTRDLALEPPAPLVLTTRDASSGSFLVPRTIDDALRVSEILAGSSIVPTRYQGKAADIFVAIAQGAEVGLQPLAALQSIAVIGGIPRIYGDGYLAVCQSSPRYRAHREYYLDAKGVEVDRLSPADLKSDETCAVCMFWVRGEDEPKRGTFSIADAKLAQLWGKAGNWGLYPARMLMWRARGFAGRTAFALELKGIKMPDDDEEDEREPTTTNEPAPIVMPLRRSAAVVETTPAAPEPTVASPVREVVEPVVITDTKYVPSPQTSPYHEIHARIEKSGAAPIGFVFVTRDRDLAGLAESATGSPQTFRIEWHEHGKSKVIDRIAAY